MAVGDKVKSIIVEQLGVDEEEVTPDASFVDDLGADYDAADIIPAIAGGLTVDGKLYAAPFYGESSFVMYRKDLFDKAGLKMPDAQTWDFIKEAADKITDKATGVNGICLRGKAGWGENMAFLTAMSNSFGFGGINSCVVVGEVA